MGVNQITVSVEKTKVSAISLEPQDSQKPYLVYHHGLYGSKNGTHSQDALKISEETGCGFIAFDNIGHGDTLKLDDSKPLEECNIENWVKVSKAIIADQVPSNASIILIGNSFGAGVLYLSALDIDHNIDSFLGISAAPDVIQEEFSFYLRQHFDNGVISDEQKADYDDGKVIYVPFPDPAVGTIPISKSFTEVADTYKVLGNEAVLSCPAVLFQGNNDSSIASDKAIRFLNQFHSSSNQFKPVANAEHSLARDSDRKQISAALQDMILKI